MPAQNSHNSDPDGSNSGYQGGNTVLTYVVGGIIAWGLIGWGWTIC